MFVCLSTSSPINLTVPAWVHFYFWLYVVLGFFFYLSRFTKNQLRLIPLFKFLSRFYNKVFDTDVRNPVNLQQKQTISDHSLIQSINQPIHPRPGLHGTRPV